MQFIWLEQFYDMCIAKISHSATQLLTSARLSFALFQCSHNMPLKASTQFYWSVSYLYASVLNTPKYYILVCIYPNGTTYENPLLIPRNKFSYLHIRKDISCAWPGFHISIHSDQLLKLLHFGKQVMVRIISKFCWIPKLSCRFLLVDVKITFLSEYCSWSVRVL